jgi:hypothetical protein
MSQNGFAAELRSQIESEYDAAGYRLGWRLLYSPLAVFQSSRVAFIGLNPGGGHRPKNHAEFAMEKGSAYAEEAWGSFLPGHAPLQQQVLALFKLNGERPESVLAGNLVPFRSPSWDALPHKQRALAFGKRVRSDILAEVRPQIVIAMDGHVLSALRRILDVRATERIPVGWGSVCGERGEFSNGTLVGLPHLSRFQSSPGLKANQGFEDYSNSHPKRADARRGCVSRQLC